MNNIGRNLIVCSGVTAAGILALAGFCQLSASCLTRIALMRSAPKNLMAGRDRLRGRDKVSLLSRQALMASKALEGQTMENIEIKAHDGIKLVGHLSRCKDAKRIIIAMHGWRSSWSRDFGSISEFWKDNDCDVLYCEQRGQGQSEGEYITFGVLERYDCLQWIRYVTQRTNGSLPIYLYGISMGASTILMTSGLDLPKSVKGIIADCGYTSPKAIWRHVVKNNLKIPYDIYSPLIDRICEDKFMIQSGCSCAEAVSHTKTPVIFIHGSNDRFVPIEMTYENYMACNSPKRLFVVPGATHGLCYLFNTKGYQRSVLNFFKDYD